ncbi:MAG: hypothetical protein GKS00_12620 [Alphaproteobacteria bacterium]|nr:hypothetical protein [Alphaproteobacteria bacterium]
MKRNLHIALMVFGMVFLSGAAHAAEEWGLPEEKTARFEAKVVDVLCELSGDCPKACGGGKRQLGLLDGSGKLVLPVKNNVIFAGVADELIEFCGKQVIADGLFTTNRGYTIFALQFVKEAPDGKWQRANRFLPKWAKKNGVSADSPKAERWFENDPRVNALIAKDGKLGLGLKTDKEYLSKQ